MIYDHHLNFFTICDRNVILVVMKVNHEVLKDTGAIDIQLP